MEINLNNIQKFDENLHYIACKYNDEEIVRLLCNHAIKFNRLYYINKNNKV